MTETDNSGTGQLPEPRRVRRRIPRRADLAPLVRFRAARSAPGRASGRAHTIEDLRQMARRRVPRAVFDYVDGAAEQEIGIRRARAAFDGVQFHPRVLRDVSQVDTSADILGARAELPLILAPTGFTRMMHHEGEVAAARAAARARIPYTLSTMGTTEPEEVRACAPEARHWFQLYLWRDRAAGEALIERVDASGYETLMLTVDTPVGGARMRDVRNGFTIPPALTPRTLAGMAARPAWWWNVLTTEPLKFAAMTGFDGTVEELVARMFDPALSPVDVEWLRARWPRKLVVKGVHTVDDARMLADLGADAIVVSSHGGRQLDRTVPPLYLLPRVVAAVGDVCQVLIDSGVRSGADLAAARALGASAAMIGRPYLYGLMAGGEQGVERAIDVLATEYTRTLQLLGARTTDELAAEHVSLRQPA
ncbi:alpha-hydroxy acid oxidase [Streptomyces sp. CFMR 7]|uniref:alpha-hydroxy acid oxidase n=1 Tax=Streptomyces sp. CFMR 7 TaxID=1649184 RepID=UPI0006AD22FE|nr:alpha-hydroxy acid oxidase [Streptomyces sp. CFMR 7]ALC25800.1 lactate dehydrogenase [Streptomyces sp. CFMR 7]